MKDKIDFWDIFIGSMICVAIGFLIMTIIAIA